MPPQPAAWHHQHEHQQETTDSRLSSQHLEQQLGQQEHVLAPPSPAGPAGSQQQQAGATQLHQLPSVALATISRHFSSAERLALGRLVFGDSHAAAAAAVLGTLHSCSVRRPHGDSRSSLGQQQHSCHEHVSCTAAVASMPHLGRLRLELQLPQQQQQQHCAWAAAVDGLAGMCQLTSLQLQLSPTAQQQQQLAQQQLATLLRAVGSLQRCKELSIRLGQPAVVSESAAADTYTAARTTAAPALLLLPTAMQPLVHLSSCLQSLQITAQQRLPAAALAHVACLSQLTALHLECSSSSSSSSTSVDAASRSSSLSSYDEAAAAALLPMMPQLRQLALIGYFQQPQQQQQHGTLLPQQGSSSGSLLSVLHHLQPSKLTALDLGCNSQRCLPFPAAAHVLAALTGLRSLGLAGAAAGAADLAVVGDGLRCLTRLDLSHDASTGLAAGLAVSAAHRDQHVTAVLPLQRWLGHYSGLQELLLCGRALTAQDFQAVLQQLRQLTALDLSGGHIGASTLAQGLCSSHHQRASNRTQLGSDATSGPGSSGAQLVRLSLRGIRLGPDGLQELVAAAAAAAPASLALSSSLGRLRELDLRGCRAGGAAVAALRRALPGLRVVRLDGMDWAEPGLEWLIGDY